MVSFTALALLLLTASCHGGKRIIDGTPTTVERYPYIVQVDSFDAFFSTWSQSCGASVLNELYVLSAAHCFESLFGQVYHPSLRRIRAGSTYRNSGGRLISIVREINHPEYGVAARFDADISIIRLASFMSFSPVIQPVRLVSEDSYIADNSPVVYAGWGDTVPGGWNTNSPVLLKAQVYTVNNEECRRRYQSTIYEVTRNMICAGLLDVGGRDACQMDSGGPLYYGDSNMLIGVVSFGQGCGEPNYPGVNTAVPSYVSWIQSIVA